MTGTPALTNLGLLASHRGTNVQAVLDACRTGRLKARPAVVISNNRDAEVLERARRAGIPTYHLSAAIHPEPVALDRAIRDTLIEHGADFVRAPCFDNASRSMPGVSTRIPPSFQITVPTSSQGWLMLL